MTETFTVESHYLPPLGTRVGASVFENEDSRAPGPYEPMSMARAQVFELIDPYRGTRAPREVCVRAISVLAPFVERWERELEHLPARRDAAAERAAQLDADRVNAHRDVVAIAGPMLSSGMILQDHSQLGNHVLYKRWKAAEAASIEASAQANAVAAEVGELGRGIGQVRGRITDLQAIIDWHDSQQPRSA